MCNFVPMYKTYIETKHENRDSYWSIGNGIGWLLIDSPSYCVNTSIRNTTFWSKFGNFDSAIV